MIQVDASCATVVRKLWIIYLLRALFLDLSGMKCCKFQMEETNEIT
jgi:hypothetical protein